MPRSRSQVSPNDSLDLDSVAAESGDPWTDLEDGELVDSPAPDIDDIEPEELPADKPPKTTGEKLCPVCGEEIVREPGKKGRLPTYHPECRPSATGKSVSGAPRRTAAKASKEREQAEYEADVAVEAFASKVRKGALLLSAVNPYDAFAVMAGLPDVCANLRAILIRYHRIRQEFMAIDTGGSILGLIIALAMILLPILAHHGLIPGRVFRQLLQNLPFAMLKMNKLLEQGADRIMEVMEAQMKAHLMAQQSAAAQKASNVDASSHQDSAVKR